MSDIRPLAQPFTPGGLNLADIALPPLPTGIVRTPLGPSGVPLATPMPPGHGRDALAKPVAPKLPRIAPVPEILAAHFVRKNYRKAQLEMGDPLATEEIQILEADRGRYMGFVRMVGRRKEKGA